MLRDFARMAYDIAMEEETDSCRCVNQPPDHPYAFGSIREFRNKCVRASVQIGFSWNENFTKHLLRTPLSVVFAQGQLSHTQLECHHSNWLKQTKKTFACIFAHSWKSVRICLNPLCIRQIVLAENICTKQLTCRMCLHFGLKRESCSISLVGFKSKHTRCIFSICFCF